jgi:hypothetical protein
MFFLMAYKVLGQEPIRKRGISGTARLDSMDLMYFRGGGAKNCKASLLPFKINFRKLGTALY